MSGTTGTPISGMTQVDYAPGLIIPAVDMTAPAGDKNVAIQAAQIVAAAQAAANAGGFVVGTSATGVAAAGTTQATATALTAQDNVISSCAAGAGVILTAAMLGAWIVVINQAANALLVYPPVGAAWNALAIDEAVSVGAGNALSFKLFSGTEGYTR